MKLPGFHWEILAFSKFGHRGSYSKTRSVLQEARNHNRSRFDNGETSLRASACSVSKSHNGCRVLARAAIPAVSRRPAAIDIDGSCMRRTDGGSLSLGAPPHHRRAPHTPLRRPDMRRSASRLGELPFDARRALVRRGEFVRPCNRARSSSRTKRRPLQRPLLCGPGLAAPAFRQRAASRVVTI